LPPRFGDADDRICRRGDVFGGRSEQAAWARICPCRPIPSLRLRPPRVVNGMPSGQGVFVDLYRWKIHKI
jgi:hypothetical protein